MKRTFSEHTQAKDIIKTTSLIVESPIIGGAYVLAYPFSGLAGLVSALQDKMRTAPMGLHNMKLNRKRR